MPLAGSLRHADVRMSNSRASPRYASRMPIPSGDAANDPSGDGTDKVGSVFGDVLESAVPPPKSTSFGASLEPTTTQECPERPAITCVESLRTFTQLGSALATFDFAFIGSLLSLRS